MRDERSAWTAATVTSACVDCAPHHGTTTKSNRTTVENTDSPNGFFFHGYHVPNQILTYDGGKIALLDIAGMKDGQLKRELHALNTLINLAWDEENYGDYRYSVIEPRPNGTARTPLALWLEARYNVAYGEWQARHDELQARRNE